LGLLTLHVYVVFEDLHANLCVIALDRKNERVDTHCSYAADIRLIARCVRICEIRNWLAGGPRAIRSTFEAIAATYRVFGQPVVDMNNFLAPKTMSSSPIWSCVQQRQRFDPSDSGMLACRSSRGGSSSSRYYSRQGCCEMTVMALCYRAVHDVALRCVSYG